MKGRVGEVGGSTCDNKNCPRGYGGILSGWHVYEGGEEPGIC